MNRRAGVTAGALWAVGLGAGALSFVGFGLARRRVGLTPEPSWPVALVLLVVAAVLVVVGRRIVETRAGRAARPLHPLGVYRTLLAAQACALTGAAVAGGYAGLAGTLLPDADFPSVRADLVAALAVAVAGAIMTGAGMWVQRICRVEPPGSEEGGNQYPAGEGGDGARA